MSIFTSSHASPSRSTYYDSSPAHPYALPSRLPARSLDTQQAPASHSPSTSRSRTQTASSAGAAASPSASRSPHHARNTSLSVGGGSQSGTPTSVLQRRTQYQQPLGTGGSVRRGEGTGRAVKRTVGCDVVLDSARAPHESGQSHGSSQALERLRARRRGAVGRDADGKTRPAQICMTLWLQ